jgi:hypothetical protein
MDLLDFVNHYRQLACETVSAKKGQQSGKNAGGASQRENKNFLQKNCSCKILSDKIIFRRIGEKELSLWKSKIILHHGR